MDVPDYYQPNSNLSLRLAEGDITVTVVEAFTPFTMGQVLVVRTNQTSLVGCLPSNSLVCLKIYDPRFFFDRKATKHRPARPWSFQAESEAAKNPRASPTAYLGHHERPEDDDPAQWEDYYYKYSESHFQAETVAYEALKSLQGTAIPKYFTAGRLAITERLAPRAISPRVILIEYIPNAKTLNDVDAKLITPMLVDSLIETARAFGGLGVVQCDVHAGNFLFSPGDCPVRAVIVDFGGALYREDESDETWAEIVRFHCDWTGVKVWVRRKLGEDNLSRFPALAR